MLDIVIEARAAAISPAVKVKRILPFRLRRMVGPFIFMDHAGPIAEAPVQPSSLDVLPHPHIGLSTVSYLFGGQVTHRDSLGVEQIIRPGEVNWMTAGRGIAHSERFEDPSALTGGLEMIQTWVALPEKEEEAAPTFDNYKPEHCLLRCKFLFRYVLSEDRMLHLAVKRHADKTTVKRFSRCFEARMHHLLSIASKYLYLYKQAVVQVCNYRR